MWLHPRPCIDDLREVYGEHYFSNMAFLSNKNEHLYGYVDYIGERINKQYGYRKIVTDILRMLTATQSGQASGAPFSWLDIGCGLGYLMDASFDRGFMVAGVEFNPGAVEYMRAKYTFPVKLGSIGDMGTDKKYHVISMMDVVEHLPDPFSDLKRARQIVHDNGYLVLSTMDSDSVVSRLLGKNLEDFRRVREHLYFFSRRTIQAVLGDCGWEVISINSLGHTFQVSFLLERLGLVWPLLTKTMRTLIYPKWLLSVNIYLNPGTKMLVYARPK